MCLKWTIGLGVELDHSGCLRKELENTVLMFVILPDMLKGVGVSLTGRSTLVTMGIPPSLLVESVR